MGLSGSVEWRPELCFLPRVPHSHNVCQKLSPSVSGVCWDPFTFMSEEAQRHGKSAGFCPPLLFSFQHKMEREGFPLQSPSSTFSGVSTKAFANTHGNHEDTKDRYFSGEPDPKPRLTEALWKAGVNVLSIGEILTYVQASDTLRIAGYVSPMPRQCNFAQHCM